MTSPRKNFRKLTRLGTHSYYVVLPPGLIRELGWRERQKLKIRRSGSKIVIENWKKEDAIDLGAIKDRAREPVRSFEDVLKNLKKAKA